MHKFAHTHRESAHVFGSTFKARVKSDMIGGDSLKWREREMKKGKERERERGRRAESDCKRVLYL